METNKIPIKDFLSLLFFTIVWGEGKVARVGEMRADISNTPREEELLLDSAYCMPTIYLFYTRARYS